VASKDQNIPLNVEQHLMRLLGLKSLDELNRVLSEPPNEQSLQEMGPPYELYELEWEDDLIDSALDEIERADRDATNAIFVGKSGSITMGRIPTPLPSTLSVVRQVSDRASTISLKLLESDCRNEVVVTFVRGFGCVEYPIYEEL
jgi:hypothetical protein